VEIPIQATNFNKEIFPNLPTFLKDSWMQLIILLKGKAPISLKLRDNRAWGLKDGAYAVKRGYVTLASQTLNPRISNPF
jgi:hypothetical protein